MSRSVMYQTYAVRETDKNYPGRPRYKVVDCFQVFIDLQDKYYGGRKMWRTRWAGWVDGSRVVGCVIFSATHQLRGDYISIRAALGIRKAVRK